MTISATTQGLKPGVCTSTNRPSAPFDGQVIYMTDVDQTAVWDGSQWTVLAPIAGGRNKIINGAMDVWQRGTSFTTDNAATVIYTADRWAARALYPGFGATQTITRESTHVPTGFVYSLKSVLSTAVPQNNGRMQFFYTMENIDSLKYAGKTITVSFQAKGIGNTNILYVAPSYNTSGGKSCDGTAILTQSFTVNTSSFTACTFTFTVPSAGTLTSSATLGLVFTYSRTAGTEQVGDGIYVGAVQMEAGAVATPFEFEDFGVTLEKCLRYYEKTYDLGTAVAAVTQVGMVGNDVSAASNHSNYIIARFPYKVRKRSAPTITVYDAGGNAGKATVFNVGAAGTNNVTTTADFVGEHSFRAYLLGITSAGFTIHYTASAEL